MPNALLAKGAPKISNEAIEEALERMKTALVDASSNLTMDQQQMKRSVDKKRRTEQFDIGEEVVQSIANMQTYCPNFLPKMKALSVGPFRI